MTDNKKSSEYDSAWKDVIEELFEPFLEFFFPAIHKDIDFSKKIEFLSKELRKIKPDSNVGKRFADELVKVYLKDGTEACIAVLIHIEVQGEKDPNFEVRVFVYNYRIYEKFREQGTQVISLAILTDPDENYRPDEYCFKRWGFEHRLKIPLVKIIDYKLKENLRKKLETSTNPMAMIVRTQLSSIEAKRRGDSEKFNIKWELFRECYKRGFDKKRIRTLLKFIDWIIRLPDDMEELLTKKISQLEEEHKMPYVPTWERRAEKKGEIVGIKKGEIVGIKKGEIVGIKKGRVEGRVEGKIETAKMMINDNMPIAKIVKYTGLSEKEVRALLH